MEKSQNLINVHDYQRTHYSAFWDIFVHSVTFQWVANVYALKDSAVLAKKAGKGDTMEEARKQSQQWVLSVIEKYKRSDAEIAKLVPAMDKAKARPNPEDAIVGEFKADVSDLDFDAGRKPFTPTILESDSRQTPK